MIKIPDRIDKTEIVDKPKVVFDGIIEEIDTEEKAVQAIEALRENKVVGFDTETRPTFTRGQGHKIALLQLANSQTAYPRLCGRFPDR